MKTKQIIGTFAVAFLGGLISILVYTRFFMPEPTGVSQSTPNAENNYGHQVAYVPSGELTNFSYAAESTINSVVHVKTQYMPAATYHPFYDFFFGEGAQPHYQPREASGSGVIISEDGYIVTNNHVIENSNNIEVVLNDKRSYPAQLIGTDPTTDIALLKINAENLQPVPLGDSDKLKIGEWVIAVGNPFNLTSTVTAGIVSAKARNINILQDRFAIESFIQTDAAVNPGNSGGALVNTAGELVGINTAIASRTGYYSGYSFAVPVSIMKKIVDDLKEFGTVQRALLGVNIREVDSELAEDLDLDKIEGVYVVGVAENGAANEAGVEKADVITKIQGIAVNTVAQLQEQISKYRPGDEVVITIKRDGKPLEIKATLRNRHGTTSIVNSDILNVLGADFRTLSDDEKAELGIEHGVQVAGLNAGKFAKAGIREGYIITRINRRPVDSINDIDRLLSSASGGVYIEGLYPNGETAYYAFGMRK